MALSDPHVSSSSPPGAVVAAAAASAFSTTAASENTQQASSTQPRTPESESDSGANGPVPPGLVASSTSSRTSTVRDPTGIAQASAQAPSSPPPGGAAPSSSSLAANRWGPIGSPRANTGTVQSPRLSLLSPLSPPAATSSASFLHSPGGNTAAAGRLSRLEETPTPSPSGFGAPVRSAFYAGGGETYSASESTPYSGAVPAASSATTSAGGDHSAVAGIGILTSPLNTQQQHFYQHPQYHHSSSGGPAQTISSPILGLGSPHNSLSVILAGGGTHEDDEHDWERDIHRQNTLGVGHEDDTHQPLRRGHQQQQLHHQQQSSSSSASSSSSRPQQQQQPTAVIGGHRSHHAHSHSQSYANWSPPLSSPVLTGSRSQHFVGIRSSATSSHPTAASNTIGVAGQSANSGHSRSGSSALSGATSPSSTDRALGPPPSLHRIIAPFHRDQQQASLSQLLLGSHPGNSLAGARSPGSSSAASNSDYFMSPSSTNNDVALFGLSGDNPSSKVVRRHQSLNHHIGRHLAGPMGTTASANATHASSGVGGASGPGLGRGSSSSTVGRSAAAAALRANAEPFFGDSGNPTNRGSTNLSSIGDQSVPSPPRVGHISPSLRSPTSPSRFAGTFFGDREPASSGLNSPPELVGNANVDPFGQSQSGEQGSTGAAAAPAATQRGRGMSDTPHNLLTIHAHMQHLDIDSSAVSRLAHPHALKRDESYDSGSAGRTPTRLTHAPHLISSATEQDDSGSSGPGAVGLERLSRAARQTASEGMEPALTGAASRMGSTDSRGMYAGADADVPTSGSVGANVSKTRKLPSLITNRDALVRGAAGGAPGAVSAAPAGFGYVGDHAGGQAGAGLANAGHDGAGGPATAGAALPATIGRFFEGSDGPGLDSPGPLSAGAIEDGDEHQLQSPLSNVASPARRSSSGLRQNTFDAALIRGGAGGGVGDSAGSFGSSTGTGAGGVGAARNGSRFNLFRGIKTAVPVASWRQKELIAGGREDGRSGDEGAEIDEGNGRTDSMDEQGGISGDSGPTALYTSTLGRASSLHHSRGPSSRHAPRDHVPGSALVPGLPSTPGPKSNSGALSGIGGSVGSSFPSRSSALQSQWGIALSPVMSGPLGGTGGLRGERDAFEALTGGVGRDGNARPTRSGSMRVPGSKARFDGGRAEEAKTQGALTFSPGLGPAAVGATSPYASNDMEGAEAGGPNNPGAGSGNVSSPVATSAAALEQANYDTLRLSLALAEQHQKTALLRAQMNMPGTGSGMSTPGAGGPGGVHGLGLPFNPSMPPPPMPGPGMGMGMNMNLGMGLGMGLGSMLPGPSGLGAAPMPGVYPDGSIMDLTAMRMVNGPDLNLGQGTPFGFPPPQAQAQFHSAFAGGDGSAPLAGAGISNPASSRLGGLPPLTIPVADPRAGPGDRVATGTIPSAVTPSSAVQMAQMIAAKGYNPPTFPMRPLNARYFVIKSFTEDDVYKCLKYEIWASTDKGNQRLDRAFRENSRAPGEAPVGGGERGSGEGKGTGPGPIFLFFSVNASGHFCGMAQMLTPVDYNTSSNVWAQDGKWKGTFKVRWIFVKDLPNGQLRHIRLTNTPEMKSVTQSRDTQELPREAGEEVLRIMAEYSARTSLLQDMSFYEMQDQRPAPAQVGVAPPAPLLVSMNGPGGRSQPAPGPQQGANLASGASPHPRRRQLAPTQGSNNNNNNGSNNKPNSHSPFAPPQQLQQQQQQQQHNHQQSPPPQSFGMHDPQQQYQMQSQWGHAMPYHQEQPASAS